MASRPALRAVSSVACRQSCRQPLARQSHAALAVRKNKSVHGQTRRYAASTSQQPMPPSTNVDPATEEATDARTRIARTIRNNAAPFAETYIAQSATETLFKECASQADYVVPQAFERHGSVPKTAEGEELGEGTGWWYEDIGLTPTFSAWCHVTMLHMWMLMVRFRYFPEQYATVWMQHLVDHFFFEAEHRMNIFHGISSRAVRNRYLKDVHNQWRGVGSAYDEGLLKGDAVLATAVWRNVFKGRDDVDWRKVALVVSFVRRGVRALDRASDKTLVGAMVRFGNPMSEEVLVRRPSKALDAAFTKEDEDGVVEMLAAIAKEDASKPKPR